MTVWPDGLSMDEKVVEFARQREAASHRNLTYCEDPDRYHFHWNGVHHGDFKCSFLESANLFVNGESQVINLTLFQRKCEMYLGVCNNVYESGETPLLFQSK